MKKLTKQEAVQKHRDMWNWIAKQIKETEEVQDIEDLKMIYCKSVYSKISYSCFLCEYDKQNNEKYCDSNCILKWRNDDYCVDGEYGECRDSETWQEQYELALQIANLEERKFENESV